MMGRRESPHEALERTGPSIVRPRGERGGSLAMI